MKITDDLLEGKDISLAKKKRLILVSSSAPLEDILHVICVYIEKPSLSLQKGIIKIRATSGEFAAGVDRYVSIDCLYDISSKESSIMLLGHDTASLGEFTTSLLKIKGMKEAKNG
tara:strand:+ start:362 stop:706 length:345 start_codon:yes stop_codon:yes gene_type:complete